MTAQSIFARRTWPRYSELVGALTRQNVQNRYRGSVFGVLWSLLNPITMTVVYVAIFGSAFRSHYGDSLALYGISVFTGLLVLNFFTQSTSQALVAVVSNAALLQKVRVPFSVFPVAAVMLHCVQFLAASLPILIVVTAYDTHDVAHVVLLVIPLASLVLASVGVGLLVSAAYVYFRDVAYLYEMVQFVVWISSPVFYPIEIVPKAVRGYFEANPLYAILTSFRELAIGGAPIPWTLLVQSALESTIVFAAGYLTFRLMRGRFMDLL